MEAPQKTSTSLRDFLFIFFRRKNLIIVFFLATVCTVAVGSSIVEPVYQAQTQILVKVGRENIYVPATGNINPFFRVDSKEKLNSAIEILKSPSLVEKTILALGPTVIYEDLHPDQQNGFVAAVRKLKAKIKQLITSGRDPQSEMDPDEIRLKQAALQFRKDLKIEGIKESTLINVSFKHPNPTMAALVVNALTGDYLEHYLTVYKSGQSNDFYQRQANFLKDKLDQNQEKLRAIKTENSITSLEEEQLLLLNKAAELRSHLNITISQKTETQNRISMLRSQLARIPKTVPQQAESADNPYLINTLEARLVELQLEEKKLLTKYTDKSRLVRNIQEEIQVVKNKLNEQESKTYKTSSSGINVTHQSLQGELLRNQAELSALKAKASTQESQLREYQKELENLGQIESKYKRLAQEIELDRKNYQTYLDKLEDSRISEAMDTEKIASVSLVEPAIPPIKPTSPKKKLNLLISMVFGMIGGLGLAFFTEYLNDRLERPEDIEYFLGTKVLTSIPQMKD